MVMLDDYGQVLVQKYIPMTERIVHEAARRNPTVDKREIYASAMLVLCEGVARWRDIELRCPLSVYLYRYVRRGTMRATAKERTGYTMGFDRKQASKQSKAVICTTTSRMTRDGRLRTGFPVRPDPQDDLAAVVDWRTMINALDDEDRRIIATACDKESI